MFLQVWKVGDIRTLQPSAHLIVFGTSSEYEAFLSSLTMSKPIAFLIDVITPFITCAGTYTEDFLAMYITIGAVSFIAIALF